MITLKCLRYVAQLKQCPINLFTQQAGSDGKAAFLQGRPDLIMDPIGGEC